MAKKYQIELKVNESQAVQAAANAAAALARTEKAAQRAAEQAERQAQKQATALERAAQKSAEMQARAAQKVADARARIDQKAGETAARQAQKVADARLRADQKATETTTRQAQKAAEARAREAERAADREVRANQRAADMKARADQRAIEVQARQAQRAAEMQERSDQRAADARARVAQRNADSQVQAAQKAQERVEALKGRALTSEEVRNKALGAIQDRMNDRRVSAATRVAEAERRAGLGMVGRFKESAGLLVDQINPATVAWTAGLAAAGLAAGELVKHWRDVAHNIDEANKFQTAYRENLPENAALKGHLGDTTKEARESLALRGKTLQTEPQARAYEGGFLNSIQVAIASGRIDQGEADQLKVMGGRFQSAENGDATTHGELVGRLPALITPSKDAQGRDIPVTANQVYAEESRVFDILSMGRSTFSSGAKQLLANSNLTTTGAFESIAEQAALQSALSVTSPDQAGEMVRWLQRGTVGAQHDKETQPYFQRLGVQDQKRARPIADAVAADITKAQAAAKAAGTDFSGEDYLRTQGFNNDEAIRGHLAYTASTQSGELAKIMAKSQGAPNSTAILNKIAESNADPRMQAQSAALAGEQRKFAADRAHLTADSYRKQVFEEMVARGEIAGDYDGPGGIANDRFPRRATALQAGVNKALFRDAQKAKIDLPNISFYNPIASQIQADQPIQESIDKLHAAKVDPFAESRNRLGSMVDSRLKKSIAAEAPGRAGLAAAAAERRIPSLIAAPSIPALEGVQPTGLRPAATSGIEAKLDELIKATKQNTPPPPKPPDPLPILGPMRRP